MKQNTDKLFPYDEPRKAQIEGMKIINKAVENNGIVPMEGACGTGKTLTALVPSLSYALDDMTVPQRVLIVTSVKQQMAAFQDEIRRINENSDDSVDTVTALTLVSVPDLHPYVEQGVIDDNDYSSIDKLREGTRILEEEYRYSFQDLVQEAEYHAESSDKYAYSTSIPELKDIEYDPYYAKYRSEKEYYDENENKDIIDMIPFDTNSAGLLTAEKLREICASNGLCPHSIMRVALEFVDVVIGNYNHIFDPKTVDRVTSPIINDESIVIFDEAHNLAPRVRNFLSKDASLNSIFRAESEIREISLIYEFSRLSKSEVTRIINDASQGNNSSNLDGDYEKLSKRLQVSIKENGTILNKYQDILEAREEVRKVMDKMKLYPDELDTYADYLSDIQTFISKKVEQSQPIDEESSIQLRDPSTPDYDDLTTWTNLGMHSNKIMKNAKTIGEVVDAARNEYTNSSINTQTSAKSVGKLLTAWHKKGHKRYYRAIEIEERYQILLEPEESWQGDYKAKLTLHNCIPRDEISSVIDKFHATTLMSATLEPIDIYNKTVGINILEDNGRPIYQCQYGLSFPVDNRDTIGISATKFNYSNRGQAFKNYKPNKSNSTRKEYNDIIYDIVFNTPGNTLIVMPNYEEAEWIGSLLDDEYHSPADKILIDKSSSNEETSKLKKEFFRSDNAVLTTAAGGTLIEGIDYVGDRLNNVIVCGVPLDNISSDYMKAVRAAYDAVFDGDGFTLAFTIPAVWKTRQAMGRVIRTDEDVGTRIIIDERYIEDKSRKNWDSVKRFLSDDEIDEMNIVGQNNISSYINEFWD